MSAAVQAIGSTRRTHRKQATGILRSNALMAASSGLVGVVSYACALLIARLLPVAAYSVFSAGQALLTAVGVSASALVPLPLARVVRFHSSGSEQRRAGVAFAVLVSLLIGLIAAGILTAISHLFASLNVSLVIGICGFGLFAIMPVWGWLQGESWFTGYAVLSLIEVSLRLIFSMISCTSGWGAEGALASYLAGVGIIVVAGIVLLRHDLAWRPRVLADRDRWLETSGIAFVQLVLAALVSADVVLVATVDGHSSAAAGYQAISTLAKGPIYVAAGTVMISFPALRAANADKIQEIIRMVFRSFAWLALPTTAVLMTVPPVLAMKVLPPRYVSSLGLMPWLAIAGLELGVVSVVAVVLLAVGAYWQSLVAVISSAIFVLSGMVMGWTMDTTRGLAIGVASGALAAMTVMAVIALPYLPSRLGGAAVKVIVLTAAGVAVLLFVRNIPWLWLAIVAATGVTVLSRGNQPRRNMERKSFSSKRLRITHLGFEDPAMPGAGGGSLRTHEINRRLAAKGHSLTVLVCRFPGCADRIQDGVKYVHIGFGRGAGRLTRLLGYMLASPIMVRRYPADLFVEDFFAPISTMAAPLWTKRPTIGMVQWLNARDKSRQYHLPLHLIERFGVRRYQHLIAVSSGTAERVAELNAKAHVEIIGNGIDPGAFTVSAERGSDVVFVGRLETAQKGLDILLQAWALAASRLAGQLVIAGKGPDEERLRQLAEKLGIAHSVRFVGWVSGIRKYQLLASARLVAIPSRFETFGIVALEALATGTPVLAFDIPCLREVIPRGCGRLVPGFDVREYAQSLVELCMQDSWFTVASSRGRQFALSFDWDVLASRQEKIYRRIGTGETKIMDHSANFQSDNSIREQLQGLGRHRNLRKRPPRLTVIGNVGNGNTGDESLLTVTLAAVDRDANVTVISRHPELVTQLHSVRAVPMTMRAAVTALCQCDGMIVVGGGMFGPGLPPLVRILPTITTWTRRSGRAVAYVGIGVYPGTPKGTLRRLRQAVEHSEVTVRDMASIRTLNAKQPVGCIGDLAWRLTPTDSALARNVLRRAGADGDRPLLLVSPKAGTTTEQTEEVINALAAAVRYWTDLGGAAAAIALSDRADRGRDFTDTALAAAVSARVDVALPVVGPNLAPSMAKAIVGCASAVVGMRFHALVFALSSGIPCMGIGGEPKTEALLDEHRLPVFSDIRTLHSWLDVIISPRI